MKSIPAAEREEVEALAAKIEDPRTSAAKGNNSKSSAASVEGLVLLGDAWGWTVGAPDKLKEEAFR
jgi:hypothetical protein